MKQKKRTFQLNRVRGKRSYSFSELAATFDVHIGTIRAWHKEGLSVLDPGQRPYLVMGYEVRRFLKARQAKRKHPLQPGEIFCPRCRCARTVLVDSLQFQPTGRKLGSIHFQIMIKAPCSMCQQLITRFSSDRQLAEWKQMPAFAEWAEAITGSADSSVNTDLRRS